MRTRTALALAALASSLAACAPPGIADTEEEKSTTSHQFFENASRRDATAAEASRIAYLEMGCTAYFLENTAGKVYLASAQHCFDNDIDTWCNAGHVTDNDGNTGQCTRVVAEDPTHDIAVFESNIPHASKGSSTLRVAGYIPAAATRLVMVGYPADEDPENPREGRLTTTEDCWVTSGVVPSPYSGPNEHALDLSVQHNCSTYGGNSGGPMYVEGTRDVIGQPLTYVRDDYHRRGADDAEEFATLGLMADFVLKVRADLVAAGIVMVDTGRHASAEETGSLGPGAPAP